MVSVDLTDKISLDRAFSLLLLLSWPVPGEAAALTTLFVKFSIDLSVTFFSFLVGVEDFLAESPLSNKSELPRNLLIELSEALLPLVTE